MKAFKPALKGTKTKRVSVPKQNALVKKSQTQASKFRKSTKSRQAGD